jgi:hypothetical protein
MKRVWFCVLAYVCVVQFSFAQIRWVNWIQSGGSVGQAIAVDKRGHVYMTGYFSGAATFGDNVLTNAGGTDIFIARLSASGEIEWLTSIGGPGDDTSSRLTAAEDGTLFITGNVTTNVVFPDGSVIDGDPFLAKFDSKGKFQWARTLELPAQHLSSSGRGKHVWTAAISWRTIIATQFGENGDGESRSELTAPTNFTYATAVALDEHHRPAITGFSNRGYVHEVAMADNDGGWSWTSTGIGCTWPYITPTAIIVSRKGEVLTTGSTPLAYVGTPYDTLFVTRHSRNGDYLSGETEGEHRGQYRGLDIALDRRGNHYEAGYAQDYYWSPNSRFAALIRGPGFEYRIKTGAYTGAALNYARGICVDEKNRVYAIGDFEKIGTIGTNVIGNGPRSVFVMRIDDAVRLGD